MTADRADPRAVAVDVLVRIERDDAYANLALPAALARSDLSDRDRAFVTELVYGTLRMRRACDWLVDRFVAKAPDLPVRTALRLGTYQLVFMGTPAHAAVSATVAVAPPHSRGFVNAVLRKVAAGPNELPEDAGVRLSYPDWVVERLVADLGEPDALGALERMDAAPRVRMRADGYVQDEASEWLADLVDAEAGMRVADLCAAPGGKATQMASRGAFVAAVDLREHRARTMRDNVVALDVANVAVVAGDARRPPLREEAFDRVLVDAPCSGLGVLRRRPDARWRVQPDDVTELAGLQAALLDVAVGLVRPGGVLTYGVCTLTAAETLGVDEHLRSSHPELVPLPTPEAPWRAHGRGALLLPQVADTDGMFVLRVRKP